MLVADAVVTAAERGIETPEDRLEVVRERFAEAGIDLDAPHLGPAGGRADGRLGSARLGGRGMMTPIHLALVVDAPHVPRRAVAEIAAALQRQLIRDVAPIWDVWATVDAFASLDHVPPGYWPILVGDYFPGNELIGIHVDRKRTAVRPRRGEPQLVARGEP